VEQTQDDVNAPAAATSLAKRLLDVVASGAGLVLASPVLLAAAAAVWLEDGRPIFFMQDRVGLRGARFRVAKFRSMRVNDTPPEALPQIRPDHELVTRSGAILRRLKIDELPQLWSVVKGDMSLIGPRPTLASQVEQYDLVQRRRLDVRPGLSGWAQVNGNTEISWNERIALDVWYVDHWSPLLDLKILAKTVAVVLFGEHPNATAVDQARVHAERARRSR
jgi:lipopolysaccharide/colanic/teichoic acid biosynthesis glycosyltransferase